MAHIIYKEEQHYRRWEVIGMVGILLTGLLYGVWTGVALEQEGLSPLWLSACIMTLFGMLIYLINVKMRIGISDNYLSYQYFPLHYKKRKVKFQDIDYCAVLEPSTQECYSGSNISFSLQERVYSTCGRKGLEIVRKDRKRIFIGSENPEELKMVIEKMMNEK